MNVEKLEYWMRKMEFVKIVPKVMNNRELKTMSKTITCCELLNLFRRYYQKKFGVDGMILFDEEIENGEFNSVQTLTKSLFMYLTKNNKLCEKCESEWKNLKNNY